MVAKLAEVYHKNVNTLYLPGFIVPPCVFSPWILMEDMLDNHVMPKLRLGLAQCLSRQQWWELLPRSPDWGTCVCPSSTSSDRLLGI